MLFHFFFLLEYSSLMSQDTIKISLCLVFESGIYSCLFFLAIVLMAIVTQTVPRGLLDLIPEVIKT